jgi:fumarate reductase subunit C
LQQARLWAWQRISAMVLAVCVVVHIVVMVIAVRGGLSAAEILGRTRGSLAFGAFYTVFVLACAVHVPIGLSNIAQEWWGFSAPAARRGALLFALVLLVLGLAAVMGVVA